MLAGCAGSANGKEVESGGRLKNPKSRITGVTSQSGFLLLFGPRITKIYVMHDASVLFRRREASQSFFDLARIILCLAQSSNAVSYSTIPKIIFNSSSLASSIARSTLATAWLVILRPIPFKNLIPPLVLPI